MTGCCWALRPLILAGAMALTTGAVLAQPTSAGVVRKTTSERVTATLGQARPTDQPAPTVALDPSLGTVYTFHGNGHPPAGAHAPTASAAPSAGAHGETAPAPSGPVITFHGGRSGPDPTSGMVTPTATGSTLNSTVDPDSAHASSDAVPSGTALSAAGNNAVRLGPRSAPTALPPLPPLPGGQDLVAEPNTQALSRSAPASDPRVADAAHAPTVFKPVVSPSSPDGADDAVEDHWATLMQNEANRLSQESDVPMTVVVVRTRDDAMRRFIAQSIMHQDLTRYTEADSGLSALFSMGSRVNNSTSPTCYLLFRRDKIAALRDQFLVPMSAKVGEKATVAFLVGHEVGHCLDYYERQRTFPTKGFWTSAESRKVGIAPAAAYRLFPNGMTPQAYTYAAAALYGDLAQRQYEERLADVFGVMWAVHCGFPARLFDDVINARKWIPRNDDHSTLPALVGLRTRYDDLQTKDVAHLWALARQVQQDVGVDASVGEGASSEAAHFNGEEKLYGPQASLRTPADPTRGPDATVVGHNRVITRPFGQAYPAPEHPIEPPPTVVGRAKAPVPKVFGAGGSTFDSLKPFGSSTISGM